MAVAEGKPIFLIKKIGGVVLIVLGLFLTGLGFANNSVEVIALGLLSLIGGAALLAFKIVRRNEPSQP